MLIEDLLVAALSTMGGNLLPRQEKLSADTRSDYYKAAVISAKRREAVTGEDAVPPSLGLQANSSFWESPADQAVCLGRAPAPRGPAPCAAPQEGSSAPILFCSWSKGQALENLLVFKPFVPVISKNEQWKKETLFLGTEGNTRLLISQERRLTGAETASSQHQP